MPAIGKDEMGRSQASNSARHVRLRTHSRNPRWPDWRPKPPLIESPQGATITHNFQIKLRLKMEKLAFSYVPETRPRRLVSDPWSTVMSPTHMNS